jgi:hypothetical protein
MIWGPSSRCHGIRAMKIRNSQVSVGEKHPSLKKEGAGHVRLTGGPVLFCLLQYLY